MADSDEKGASENDQNESNTISGDRPRQRIEEDRLGYTGFARALARTLRDGVVLAVHGAWGSGKTSAVNMALDVLTSEEPSATLPILVHFSPWWISEQENLVRAFFDELSAELKGRVSGDLIEPLKAFGKRVSKAGDLAAAALSLVPGASLAAPAVKAAMALASITLGDEISLDAARRKVSDALKAEARRILIVIDDVDRLPEVEARQIFRLVKSVGDLPNVTYLLVFDRQIADRVMGGTTPKEGPGWLEKIVQGSFDLPAPHPIDLQRLFTDRVQSALGPDDKPDLRRWVDVFHKGVAPWLRTPRDVVRLSNAFLMSWPAAKEEVNFSDFVAIEALRLFSPDTYDLIRRGADMATGFEADYKASAKPFAAGLLSSSPPGRESVVKATLTELFPRLKAIWTNYHEQNAMAWDRERRVCSPRRFPAYFTFSVGDDALSRSALDRIVAALADESAFREAVAPFLKERRRAGGTKAAVVLDEIAMAADRMESSQALAAASTLIAASDLFQREESPGHLATPPSWQVYFALSPLLKRLDEVSRESVLMNAIESDAPYDIVTFLITALAGQHGLEEQSEAQPEDERWVGLDALTRLRDALVARLEISAETGALLKIADPAQTLFYWAKRTSDDHVRAWLTKQMQSREGTLYVAKAFTSEMVVSSYESYATARVPRVDRASTSTIVDIDVLTQKLGDLAAGAPDDTEVALARANWVKGLGSSL